MLSAATKAAANVTKDLAENDIRHAGRDVENHGRDVLHNINDYANEAGQKVRGAFDTTVDRTRSFSQNIESEIKSNPIRSSALALGAGFILGALLSRR